ncbi:MAG TPA: MBL fold metallo-hydrolase [Steroidobacteraceae bacterium]|nr:MBL fold metallo-hydrolase [Steroidobacteraceae bacterium]
MTSKVRLSGVLAAGAMALALGSAADAGAPQQKTQAPGYYRMMVGDFEITALCDGTFPMNATELLTHVTPQQITTDLERSFLKEPVEGSVNGFLVNTGSKLVLIDTGAGAFFGPSVGKLVANLKASGYQPSEVDEIYITHMHGDHVGGLLSDGKIAFPNATVRAAQQEADYWLSKANLEAAPKEKKESFESAMKALDPYVSAGKFKPFKGDVELVAGVHAMATPGHTPGHTAYVVESKGEKLILWGDLMHIGAVQFPDPGATIHFDTDSPGAAEQRKRVFAEAARERSWVGGAHVSFPGIGHLRSSDSGYVFVPANYTSLQH